MLIYNFQKEFLGIDESDLKKMGFQNLAQLRAEAADFADLFVKTPGFVHNFKHVHWIDFIECAESDENANVIIHANDKNFRCTIEIKTTFLVDAPSQKAYLIYLNNLRELSKAESEQVANDVYEKPTPKAAKAESTKLHTQKSSHEFDKTEEFKEECTISKTTVDPYEADQQNKPIDVLDTPDRYIEDTPIELNLEDDIEENQEQAESFTNDDFKLDIEDINKEPQTKTHTETNNDKDTDFDNSYVYDPHVASDELGLPLDLIEEFIGDFIAQAKDFKDQLYTAHNNGDEDQVKVLSHKLKGVAANLRIEDAFEVLSIINTSSNHDEIGLNLDRLYKIVAKLSNEDIPTPSIEAIPDVQEIEEEDEDDFTISFKDDDNFSDKEEPLETEIPIELEVPEVELEAPIELNEEIETKDEDNNSAESYNKSLVAKEIGIDLESFNELFDDFITESKLLIKDIKNSIEEKNIELWRKNTLKLKGMSDNMRVTTLKEEFNTLLKTDDVNIAQEVTNKLQTSLEKISNL